MATLHVLSHSPFGDIRLNSCLRLLGVGDGVLLCGDAVYALQPGTPPYQALEQLPNGAELFVLDEDLKARALASPDWVLSVDYPAFVALSCRYDKVNSWL